MTNMNLLTPTERFTLSVLYAYFSTFNILQWAQILFNIHSIRTKIYKKYKNSGGADFAPNLLKRNFVTDAPDKIWVGDITYIPTLEGWLYLAIVKDLFTKKIVGYAFSARPDSKIVCDALLLALKRQKPNANLIFHSDRGCQYNSYAFKALLAKYKFVQSMSRSGNPYDNAVAENFFSCLKCECVHHSRFISRKEACCTLFAQAITTAFFLTVPLTGFVLILLKNLLLINLFFLSFFMSVFSRRVQNYFYRQNCR